MKAFHLTTYKPYSPKARPKLALLSDVHFSPQVSTARLNAITAFFKRRQPDYILFPGDLFDSNESLDDPKEVERLLTWLKRLSQVAPVLYSLGNHEFLRQNPARKPHWQYQYNAEFFARLAQIQNFHILDDASFERPDLYAFGLTLGRDYFDFEFSGIGASILHPQEENKTALLHSLQAHRANLTDLPKGKLKVALIHSPVYLQDENVKAQLQEFDLVIAGHMHNGVVPPVISEIIPSKKGIIAPAKQFFPDNSRNTFKSAADQLIVLGPVTTFHACTGPLHHLNAFYPTYLSMLEFSPEQKYARKPYIQRKYLSK